MSAQIEGAGKNLAEDDAAVHEKEKDHHTLNESESNGANEEGGSTPLCILKPSFVCHATSRKNKTGDRRSSENGRLPPIYSIDVHPDGTRFATGGADFAIKIWSMSDIQKHTSYPPANENHTTSTENLLCELKNHNGSVNCVKWSGDGSMLASGSDDKSLMIWELDTSGGGGGSSSSFFLGGPCIERWSCKTVLRATNNEVQDLAWSPDSRRVLSGHLDNSIVIWDAKTGGQLQILKGHKGWVTGVAWDPKNRYIASQASDGMVMLWNVEDGDCVRKIEDPFETKSFGRLGGFRSDLQRQVTFTRLGWSPDGKYLGACRGYYGKSKDFVSPIFERGTWNHVIDYTGHNRPTTCLRFCPRRLRDTTTNKDKHAVAVGGMDNKITIWISSRAKAVICLDGIFKQTVLDIAWTPDGSSVVACSHDGTVAVFRLDLPHHLGCSVVEEDYTNHHDLAPADELVESAEILLLRRKSRSRKSFAQINSSGAGGASRADEKNTTTTTINNVKVRRKKRSAQTNATHSAGEKKRRLGSGPASGAKGDTVSRMQKEFKTSSGKRRIVPVSTSAIPTPTPTSTNINNNNTNTNTNTNTHNKHQNFPTSSNSRQNQMSTSPMSRLMGSRGSNTVGILPLQRRGSRGELGGWLDLGDVGMCVECEVQGDDQASSCSKFVGRVVASKPASKQHAKSKQPQDYHAPSNQNNTNHYLLTITGVLNKHTNKNDKNNNKNHATTTNISTGSGTGSSTGSNKTDNIHEKQTKQRRFSLWSQVLPSRVLAVCANQHVVAAATQDRLLHLFSTKSGRKLYLPTVLPGDIYSLGINSQHKCIYTLTSDATFQTFRVTNELGGRMRKGMKCSIAALRGRHSDPPSDVWLGEGGLPHVGFADNTKYIYDDGIESWGLESTAESWASEFFSLLGGNNNNKSSSSNSNIGSFSAKNDGPQRSVRSLLDAPRGVSKIQTREHLESLVGSAVLASDIFGFREALLAYARHLSLHARPPSREGGDKTNDSLAKGSAPGQNGAMLSGRRTTSSSSNLEFSILDELCSDLLGPDYDMDDDDDDDDDDNDAKEGHGGWKNSISFPGSKENVKIPKWTILEEVLEILAMAPRLQRYTLMLKSRLDYKKNQDTEDYTGNNHKTQQITQETSN
mmetsp:Transcript_31741/g.55790  ORF Transcript_31741/g.55790 Transcript_31741/m.55790 type:complete len:1138 (-) Transcript_31741:219-3632(-)|eukprot:CAMPEP_0197522972 /NCGR_PEP_ID=MMETSP1318-20131121/8002_1 /TAXON_ID=552666 /ORGANISM="Partenskyella glossopodia, Strain RCC365" /LENGTH=1137 /DNA_ID=CAMNT_0043075509 /DNA_START=185 /DNA_END=3598 /DNA_ORIENTATION=+